MMLDRLNHRLILGYYAVFSAACTLTGVIETDLPTPAGWCAQDCRMNSDCALSHICFNGQCLLPSNATSQDAQIHIEVSPPNDLSPNPSHHGYALSELSGTNPLTITLPDNISVAGSVVTELGNINGVLKAIPKAPDTDLPLLSQGIDLHVNDSRFEGKLIPGVYTLRFQPSRSEDTESPERETLPPLEIFNQQVDSASSDLTVTYPRLYTYTGKIYRHATPSDGKVENLKISAVGNPQNDSPLRSTIVTTDALGNYSFLLPGRASVIEITVHPHPEGRSPKITRSFDVEGESYLLPDIVMFSKSASLDELVSFNLGFVRGQDQKSLSKGQVLLYSDTIGGISQRVEVLASLDGTEHIELELLLGNYDLWFLPTFTPAHSGPAATPFKLCLIASSADHCLSGSREVAAGKEAIFEVQERVAISDLTIETYAELEISRTHDHFTTNAKINSPKTLWVDPPLASSPVHYDIRITPALCSVRGSYRTTLSLYPESDGQGWSHTYTAEIPETNYIMHGVVQASDGNLIANSSLTFYLDRSQSSQAILRLAKISTNYQGEFATPIAISQPSP
jgi:hypothetical protein